MFKLPSLSPAISKDLRYGEGYAMWLLNFAMLVGALVPADGLSTKTAATIAAVNTMLHLVSARLLQGVAMAKGLGVGAPLTPRALTAATGEVDAAAKLIVPQAVADLEHPNAGQVFDQVQADESQLVALASPAAIADQVVSDEEEFASAAAVPVAPALAAPAVPAAPVPVAPAPVVPAAPPAPGA